MISWLLFFIHLMLVVGMLGLAHQVRRHPQIRYGYWVIASIWAALALVDFHHLVW